jgi:hypothetical protein
MRIVPSGPCFSPLCSYLVPLLVQATAGRVVAAASRNMPHPDLG